MAIIVPRVCIDENLQAFNSDGKLRVLAQSVPRLVVDTVASSSGDGTLVQTTQLPGKLLIEIKRTWKNNATLDQLVLLRMVRGPRSWVTSNPNAVQFRDRWTWAIDAEPSVPVTSDILNGQVGSALDLGTNSVAEPNPGKQYMWVDVHTADEVIGPVAPLETLHVWYRQYVWTPPPWSDNANKNTPEHTAAATFARMMMIALPQQGELVAG